MSSLLSLSRLGFAVWPCVAAVGPAALVPCRCLSGCGLCAAGSVALQLVALLLRRVPCSTRALGPCRISRRPLSERYPALVAPLCSTDCSVVEGAAACALFLRATGLACLIGRPSRSSAPVACCCPGPLLSASWRGLLFAEPGCPCCSSCFGCLRPAGRCRTRRVLVGSLFVSAPGCGRGAGHRSHRWQARRLDAVLGGREARRLCGFRSAPVLLRVPLAGSGVFCWPLLSGARRYSGPLLGWRGRSGFVLAWSCRVPLVGLPIVRGVVVFHRVPIVVAGVFVGRALGPPVRRVRSAGFWGVLAVCVCGGALAWSHGVRHVSVCDSVCGCSAKPSRWPCAFSVGFVGFVNNGRLCRS